MSILASVTTSGSSRAGLPILSGHTVVELRDIDNQPLLELVGGGEHAAHPVQALVPHDIIGRLMIQCAQQSHLAEVYDALCGFDGAEFYFKEWPRLVGALQEAVGQHGGMGRDASPAAAPAPSAPPRAEAAWRVPPSRV